jgi:RimJ/RimL family protein N-acetyltransferase
VDGERPLPEGSPAGCAVGTPAWTTDLATLKSPLVTLREIDLLDAPVLLGALDRADLEASIEPAPTTRQELRRYIAWVHLQRAIGRAAGFAVVPRGTRHAAGLIQVRLVAPFGGVAEWGVVVAPRLRGSGVASEAARLLVEFAFDVLGVERLEARASGIDPSSIPLLRKLGAVREAHLRRSFVRGDQVLDDDLWTILKSDWRGAHAASLAGRDEQ